MVYGCCFWPIQERENMKKKYSFFGKSLILSLIDSKQVKEADREIMFDQIKEMEYHELGYFTTIIDPESLSNDMLSQGSNFRNLNTISHDTAIALIQRVINLEVNLTRVILDTVGIAEKYQEKLSRIFKNNKFGNEIEIIVESKADANHPVVSAASICAKVTRDKCLENW